MIVGAAIVLFLAAAWGGDVVDIDAEIENERRRR
jgi:hypothetical protein